MTKLITNPFLTVVFGNYIAKSQTRCRSNKTSYEGSRLDILISVYLCKSCAQLQSILIEDFSGLGRAVLHISSVVLSFHLNLGALIFYTLQVKIWFTTIAKTYPRTFISELLFLKKVTHKIEIEFFFLILVF